MSSKNILQQDLLYCYCGPINIREVTIAELRRALDFGIITIEELTKCYIKRIEMLNPTLHAVIEVNPEAISIAQGLDKELRDGICRGPMHGIPILLKDNIATFDKMETCAGSTALVGLKPKEDSPVARRLRKAGAVILGKANLSEFANYRGNRIPDGWSGRGGHCSHAYMLGENPSGSSSGSAVAVSANLVPVSLGTETNGSIISPCNYAGVVGIKPTVGVVPGKGVLPLAPSQDSVGPIARTVTDAAIVFDVISDKKLNLECFNIRKPSLEKLLSKNFRVGVPRNSLWDEAVINARGLFGLDKALEALKMTGIVDLIDPLPSSDRLGESFSSQKQDIILRHEFKSALNEYLNNDVQPQNSNDLDSRCSGIRCLTDVIDFNQANPTPEGYNQSCLEEANATKGIHDENYRKVSAGLIQSARNEIDSLLQENALDAIVIPSDSSYDYTAVAGYPIITVPAGFTNSGYPYGMAFFGTANSEDKLLQIAFLLESVYKARSTSLFKAMEV